MPCSKGASSVRAAVLAVAVSAATTGIASAQDAALVKKGQEVYAAQKCSICHSIAGQGSKANPLDGVGAKPADELRAWIADPVAMTKKTQSKKKPAMPKNAKLSAGDIDALVAYMQSLK